MTPQRLAPDTWRALEAAHHARAEAFTREHLERRRAGTKHPVYDFLFEYYPVRPAHLRRWHPGVFRVLQADATHCAQATWRDYVVDSDGIRVDVRGLVERKGATIAFIRELLERTEANPSRFDCFGLHEWAMVYRTDQPRHPLPLRLGRAGTDAVVAASNIKCTHFDAYRFFTEPARPLNATVLTRERQPDYEQRGCLHVGMDLYKWATKLGPLVPGELWLDTFELARANRELDMQASPYDCRAYGLAPVCIETAEGKATYVARQRALADEASALRRRLMEVIDAARLAGTTN